MTGINLMARLNKKNLCQFMLSAIPKHIQRNISASSIIYPSACVWIPFHFFQRKTKKHLAMAKQMYCPSRKKKAIVTYQKSATGE